MAARAFVRILSASRSGAFTHSRRLDRVVDFNIYIYELEVTLEVASHYSTITNVSINYTGSYSI